MQTSVEQRREIDNMKKVKTPKSPEIAMQKLYQKSTKEEVQKALPSIKLHLSNVRNEYGYCPFCNSHIEDRTETLYKELILALNRVMGWCKIKGRNEFEMLEVKDLMDKSAYSRWGNLIHYEVGVAKYHNGNKEVFRLDIPLVEDIFKNRRTFIVKRKVNMITKETIQGSQKRKYLKEISTLKDFLDDYGNYYPSGYRKRV